MEEKETFVLDSSPKKKKKFIMFKDRFIKDLDEIFNKAMESGKLSVALKTKEILCKIKGIFSVTSSQREVKPLSEWSDEEIEAFLRNEDAE